MLSKIWSSGHLHRSIRLYRSTRAFCCGVPGWMWPEAMPLCSVHSMGGTLTYSRPLPTLIVFGASRHSMIWFKTRMVRSVGFFRFSRLRGLIRRFSSNLI